MRKINNLHTYTLIIALFCQILSTICLILFQLIVKSLWWYGMYVHTEVRWKQRVTHDGKNQISGNQRVSVGRVQEGQTRIISSFASLSI